MVNLVSNLCSEFKNNFSIFIRIFVFIAMFNLCIKILKAKELTTQGASTKFNSLSLIMNMCGV